MFIMHIRREVEIGETPHTLFGRVTFRLDVQEFTSLRVKDKSAIHISNNINEFPKLINEFIY